MALSLILIAVGLPLMVWSADRFITAVAALGRRYGVPPLVLGLAVVGFGTSLPELLVSVLAAAQGNDAIALGNAFGSNITNIALILGLTALITPLAVDSRVLRVELTQLTLVTLLAGVLLLDGRLSRHEGGLLFAGFLLLTVWVLRQGRRAAGDPLESSVEAVLPVLTERVRHRAVAATVGLAGLLAGSRLLLEGATGLARGLGVPDLLIGLTVVSVGTSLPELVSSLMAARRGENALALGNVLGSNLFNTLAVAGAAGLVRPLAAGPDLLRRDLPVLFGLTLALYVVGYGFRGPGRINRWEGGVLLAAYVGYLALLVRAGVRL